jgi:polysaccharide biosynthesis/export protein
MNRLLTVLTLALLVALPLAAQDFPFPQNNVDARIGSRDVLEIKVVQDPTLNARLTVTDDGRINMGLIGKIDVGGLTPSQAEARIKSLLESKYMTRADVSVQVVEYGSKPISVVGAVMRPGSIGVSGNITLVQAITAAGGLGQGYGRTLYVLRTAQNGLTEQLAIDIEDLMVNGNPDLNIPLSPNDVVNVQMDTPITIYVFGEVMHPGTVTFRRSQTPTLLQAIAGAGGPTDRASSSVRINRTVNGKSSSLVRNYRSIAEGRKQDEPLQDGDTIWLKASVF